MINNQFRNRRLLAKIHITAMAALALLAACSVSFGAECKEMKIYADKTAGALLAFAPTIGKVTRDGRLGAPGGNAMPGFAWGTEKIEKQWMHLAYVYDGGRRSGIRLFIDGKLVQVYHRRSLASMSGHKMYMGAGFDMASGEQNMFQGAIATLKAYDYVRSDAQIKAAAK